jgi:hypothetical protein
MRVEDYIEMGYELEDAEWFVGNEPMPFWAIGKTNDPTEIGAQLPTKDGRICGNGVVISKEIMKYSDQDCEVFSVLTDAGNMLRCTAGELEELFYPPRYLTNPDEAVGHRNRKV